MLSFLIVSCAKISFAQESDLAISHENNLPIFDFEASEDINLLEAPQCDNPILFEKVGKNPSVHSLCLFNFFKSIMP